MNALKEFGFFWALAAAYIPLRVLLAVMDAYERKYKRQFPVGSLRIFGDLSNIFVVATAMPDRSFIANHKSPRAFFSCTTRGLTSIPWSTATSS